MSEVQLPEGWVWRTLQTLGRWSGGGTPSKARPEFWFNGGIDWVSPKDMKSKYILETEDKITEEAVIDSSAKYIEPPAILFVVRSGILRRTLPIALVNRRVTVNQDIKTLSISGAVDPEYLYYYIQCENRRILKDCSKAGTTVESIETNLLKQVSVPLPPIPVQHQIVAKIEELFSELDAGVKELQTALVRLKTYRQAVLHHHLTNPDWERVKLGEVNKVISGNAFKSSEFVSKGVPVVKISNVGYSEYVIKNQEYLPEQFLDNYESFKVKPGDLIFALTRPITNDTTKVCYYPDNEHTGLLNQRVTIIQPSNRIDKKFIFYFMQGETFKKYIKSKFTETLQPNLSPNDLKRALLPLPDLSTQAKIVSEIEARLSEADAMEITIRQEIVRAENLRQSILKQAFEGKLFLSPIEEMVLESIADVSESTSQIYGGSGDQLSLF